MDYVPVILLAVASEMSRGRAAEAIEWLDDLHISNDQFKEHVVDLCLNKALKERLLNLESGKKAAFTRQYNTSHDNKQGYTVKTKGAKKGAAKTKGAANAMGSDSDSEEEFDSMLGEDEIAERRKGRQQEKELAKKERELKADQLTMIKADLDD